MNISKKQISLFFALYAALRIFSYFFQPQTPLHGANIFNTALSTIILLATIYLLWKKDERGWYIVALEMILGGAGGYLSIAGISLRTFLLATSLSIFFGQKISNIKYQISNFWPAILLVCWTILSAIHGYFAGNNLHLVISDTIPYFFFLYYFPLRELLQSKKIKELCGNALVAAIIGNFALIIFTFIGYSSGWLVLQDSYYHWYRDVSLGKITELPFHFYRLVLNEHLLLIPTLILFLYQLIAKKEKNLFLVPCSLFLLIILSLNLTRIYLVALLIGLIFLFSRQNWKRWLAVSLVSCIVYLISFTAVHFLASRGQSLGWELFGIRLQSLVNPNVEESSLSRMLLLPKIVEKIRQNPIFGSGLGDTVTVYSPVFKENITTPHFDWGYLEIITEVGIVGFALWLLVIGYLLLVIKKNTLSQKNFCFASLAALLVVNITSPALFHVLGIVWLTFLFSITPNSRNQQPISE